MTTYNCIIDNEHRRAEDAKMFFGNEPVFILGDNCTLARALVLAHAFTSIDDAADWISKHKDYIKKRTTMGFISIDVGNMEFAMLIPSLSLTERAIVYD